MTANPCRKIHDLDLCDECRYLGIDDLNYYCTHVAAPYDPKIRSHRYRHIAKPKWCPLRKRLEAGVLEAAP